MKFLPKKQPKIYISSKSFYWLMASILLMTFLNAIFLGFSMTTESLTQAAINTDQSYNTVKWQLIGNYITFSSILIIFSIHTVLGRGAVKVGYIYTNLWIALVSAVVAIPIVLRPDFTDFRIWMNLLLFITFLSAMFTVYKDIYEVRKMKGYWVENNGGMEW